MRRKIRKKRIKKGGVRKLKGDGIEMDFLQTKT